LQKQKLKVVVVAVAVDKVVQVVGNVAALRVEQAVVTEALAVEEDNAPVP
jgi:hypothetical protein